MQRLRQLVCGSDFSAGAQQALAMAMELARAATARITLVHVCELDLDGTGDLRLRECERALSRLVATQLGQGLEITGMLRSGRPWEKLDNVAAEVGASLIVIGRQGAGRGASVRIGSVAEQLVRSASRPVLTVACELDRPDIQTQRLNRF